MIPRMLLRVLSYTLVAGFAGLISLGLFYVFTEYVGIYYIISLVVSYLIAHTFNYLINLNVAFRGTHAKKRKSYPLFMMFGLLSVSLIALFTFLLTEYASVWYFYARLVATPLAGIINFSMNYWFSFDMKEYLRDDLRTRS